MEDNRTRCTSLVFIRDYVCIHQHDLSTDGIGTFDLIWTRQFAYPLHCLLYEDITKDGLKEVVALSTAGVHVLQV